MTNLIIFALWILFSMMEGMREAYYYSAKLKAILGTQKPSGKTNEHAMFTVQRVIALAIAAAGMLPLGLVSSLLVLAACICCFPFFHDGAYYVTRKNLDGIYPEGWFAQSATSTAISDKLHLFGPVSRSLLTALAMAIMVFESIKF
jgi:hypothetical protein